jgi:hypothetical protein
MTKQPIDAYVLHNAMLCYMPEIPYTCRFRVVFGKDSSTRDILLKQNCTLLVLAGGQNISRILFLSI